MVSFLCIAPSFPLLCVHTYGRGASPQAKTCCSSLSSSGRSRYRRPGERLREGSSSPHIMGSPRPTPSPLRAPPSSGCWSSAHTNLLSQYIVGQDLLDCIGSDRASLAGGRGPRPRTGQRRALAPRLEALVGRETGTRWISTS